MRLLQFAAGLLFYGTMAHAATSGLPAERPAVGADAFDRGAAIATDAERLTDAGLVVDQTDERSASSTTIASALGLPSIEPGAALGIDRRVPHGWLPFVGGGLLALLVVVIADAAPWRRKARALVAIDATFETNAFVVPPSRIAPARIIDPPVVDEKTPPDPLRHFRPDAPPVPKSASERSRPDYIRVDDDVEVWTPSKVAAARDPERPARRRRTDAPGSDYRFHRLNVDGTVKTAELKRFTCDLDAQRFAETLGAGDAVEVWVGERRLSTIPPNFFT